MLLRTATEADLVPIMALENAAFEHGSWSRNAWHDEVVGADRYCVVACTPDVVAVATFQSVADVADLHRVIVSEECRGRRIGEHLVCDGQNWARARGATRMLLEVSERNEAALALYRRLGYVEIARRNDYYSPGEAALVMEVTL